MYKRLVGILLFFFIISFFSTEASAKNYDLYADDAMYIYSDFSRSDQDLLLQKQPLRCMFDQGGLGSPAGVFYMFYDYQVDIGLPILENDTERVSSSYISQRVKALRFYKKVKKDYYFSGHGWVCDYTYMEDGELCAAVNYEGNARSVIVPNSIITDEGKAKVRTLSLDNPTITKVYVRDNVIEISECKCPNLLSLKGCENVEKIGSFAFYNCVRLKKLPEFPNLQSIGEFAFEGCLSLTDIALPDNITYIDATAFGWYDVVLGNYDNTFGALDLVAVDYYPDVRDYLCDDDKIYGITLYANPDSETYWTLYRLYDSGEYLYCDSEIIHEKITGHVSYNTMDAFPGVEEDEEDEEIEDEVINWTYDPSVYEEDPYVSEPVEEDKKEDELSNSEESILEYLLGLFAANQITMDMLLVLMFAMQGLKTVPDDFISKFQNDEMAKELVKMSNRKAKEAEEAKAAAQAAANDEEIHALYELTSERMRRAKMGLDYVSLLLSYDKFADHIPNNGIYSAIIAAGKGLNKSIELLQGGASYDEAIIGGMSGTGTGYLVDMALPPQLKYWDVAITCLFGSSKAADAASIGSNAEHLIDFTAAVLKVTSKVAKPEEMMKEAEKLWKELTDINNPKYGQNLTNAASLIDLELSGPEGIYNMIVGIQEIGVSKFLTDIVMSAEDVLVKDNGLVDNDIMKMLIDPFTEMVKDYYSN